MNIKDILGESLFNQNFGMKDYLSMPSKLGQRTLTSGHHSRNHSQNVSNHYVSTQADSPAPSLKRVALLPNSGQQSHDGGDNLSTMKTNQSIQEVL